MVEKRPTRNLIENLQTGGQMIYKLKKIGSKFQTLTHRRLALSLTSTTPPKLITIRQLFLTANHLLPSKFNYQQLRGIY